MKKVELEDNGQDFLHFITDNDGVIQEAHPFQTSVWKGGVIPIEIQEIGMPCMIHHPPNINYGFLKHNVLSISDC